MSETHTESFFEGSLSAPRRVLIFHGYTGSPDGLREVARVIARERDAYVSVPLLPGHGTRLEDLQTKSFDDFLDAARTELQKISAPGIPVAILGYCFGGYLAAILASEYKPAVLALGLTAYEPRFPANMPGVAWVMNLRSSWDKYLHQDELAMRRGLFYYPRMPGKGQSLVDEGIRRFKKILPDLDMPILTMHTTGDPTVATSSGKKILAASAHNPHNEKYLLPHRRHALFFGPHKDEDIALLTSFLKKNLV